MGKFLVQNTDFLIFYLAKTEHWGHKFKGQKDCHSYHGKQCYPRRDSQHEKTITPFFHKYEIRNI